MLSTQHFKTGYKYSVKEHTILEFPSENWKQGRQKMVSYEVGNLELFARKIFLMLKTSEKHFLAPPHPQGREMISTRWGSLPSNSGYEEIGARSNF